jgi:hypothetical protein
MATREEKEYYTRLWEENSGISRIGCGTPMLACLFAVLILLCSCATKRKVEYVEREVVKHQKEMVHDTLIQHTHDSIYHTIFQKGDTVYDTKFVEKTKWRDRVVVKSDTCFRDSIQIQVKETVVEKHNIPKWCYYCLGLCVLFIIVAFIRLVRWLQIH